MAVEIPDPEEWTPPEEELWTLWLIVDVEPEIGAW